MAITVLNDKELSKLDKSEKKNQNTIRKIEIHRQLVLLGANRYDLKLPETHNLHHILHKHETILGIIYGRYRHIGEGSVGRGALLLTDKRLMLVDKKPLFLSYDEINHESIDGASISSVGPGETVTVHTKLGDIHIRTFNKKCATTFMSSIEEILMNKVSK